jgi:hypothetical protein
MANINLINSVAKAYRSMNAPLVTQAGAQALGGSIIGAASDIVKGFKKAKEASVKSQKALQKNLNYTPEDFTDLDLSEAQIEIIDNIYDEYNEGAKLVTNPRRKQRDEEGGRKMMNNAKKRLDDLYDSLTKFGTTLNNVKKNVNQRSNFNDPLQTVLYDYMVNNHQDFMKRVKIDENGRAFFPMAIDDDPKTEEIEQGNRLIYLDELEDLVNIDVNAGNAVNLDLYNTVIKIANQNLPQDTINAQIEARVNSTFNGILDDGQKGSIIFDGIYLDNFLTFLVEDKSFKKAYPNLAEQISKIKTTEDAEDVAATIEIELINAMKSGEYDLFNDYREFTLNTLMNTDMKSPKPTTTTPKDKTGKVQVQLEGKGVQYIDRSRIEDNKNAVKAQKSVLGLDGIRYMPEVDRSGKLIGYTSNIEGIRNFLPVNTFKYNNILFGESKATTSKLP